MAKCQYGILDINQHVSQDDKDIIYYNEKQRPYKLEKQRIRSLTLLQIEQIFHCDLIVFIHVYYLMALDKI